MSNDTADDDPDVEDINDQLDDIEVIVQGDRVTLNELLADAAEAHEALDNYKRGANEATSAIEKNIIEAELRGDEETAELLAQVKRAVFGVSLRIDRGDEELLGEREGPYSGYFDQEPTLETTSE